MFKTTIYPFICENELFSDCNPTIMLAIIFKEKEGREEENEEE